MGVEKVVIKPGNGCDVPKKHDEVSMEYTGSTTLSRAKADVSPNLQVGYIATTHQTTRAPSEYIVSVHHFPISAKQRSGRWTEHHLRFDTSVGRGDLITPIGVGRVIRGPFLSSCSRSAPTLLHMQPTHRDVHTG